MKSTCPVRTIFHWLALGLALGWFGLLCPCYPPMRRTKSDFGTLVGSARVFGYQLVGIGKAKCSRVGLHSGGI